MSLILSTKPSKDYELLDSGDGEKLERYGQFVLRRPDPQSLWRPRLDKKVWDQADAVFARESREAGWQIRAGVPERWEAKIGGVKFLIRPTAFKHTGVFPEQASNWDWLRAICHSRETCPRPRSGNGNPALAYLNQISGSPPAYRTGRLSRG